MQNYNNKIIKSNILIKSHMTHMTVTEYKILNHMIRNIGFGEKELRTKEYEVKDINQNILKRKNDTLYHQLKYNFSKTLLSKQFHIRDGKEFELYNFFSSIKSKEGFLKVCLNHDLEQFLIDDEYLKTNGYTTLDADIVNNLSSFYSMRIYEIMLSLNKFSETLLDISELKKMLGVENKYKNFFDFKKYILEPAVDDINRNSNILVFYEANKEGRRFTKIKLKKKVKRNYRSIEKVVEKPVVKLENKEVTLKKENKKSEEKKVNEDQKLKLLINDVCEKFSNIAVGYKLDRLLIKELIKKVGEDKIYKYLDSWHSYMNIKNMKHPAKYFYKCVKENIDIWAELNTNPYDAPNSKYDGKPSQSKNFEQREYDDEFFESLYDNFN